MYANDKERAGAVGCFRTRDARVHVALQVSATLSPAKLAFALALAALVALFALGGGADDGGGGGGGGVGAGDASTLRRRVRDLEAAMGRKLSWVLQHQRALRDRLLPAAGARGLGLGSGGGGGAGGAGAAFGARGRGGGAESDGRRHLWNAPGGLSRLAEALAPRTQLAPFDDHYLCGDAANVAGSAAAAEEAVTRKTVALAAVTWRAPLSLRNSMESWRRGGLLDLVDERMLFVNSPSPEDLAIARDYEFDVYTTEERGGNVMAGPALAYLVGNSSADYILFMEKDFVLSADRATTARELYVGVQHLARGVDLYRLRGKTDHPAEGMPDCCEKPADPAAPPNCPFYSAWKSGGYFSDHMNW